MKSPKYKVLAHASCGDGKMAAFLLWKHFKYINREAEFAYVKYNEPPPDVTGYDVFIVDFSYPKDTIDEMSKVATSITMLDHHLTASQQWGGYIEREYVGGDQCNVHIILNEHESGALMTYNYLKKFHVMINGSKSPFTNERLISIVNAVSDRDLWEFKLPNTAVITDAVNAFMYKPFEEIDDFVFKLGYKDYAEVLARSAIAIDVKETMAQQFAKLHQLTTIDGYTVPIVNVPANFASRVGEILNKVHPFAITYCVGKQGVICSLRSDKVTGIDVSEVAKKLGGGGHLHASGCLLSMHDLCRLLNSEL